MYDSSAYSQWVIRRFTALFGKGVGLSSIDTSTSPTCTRERHQREGIGREEHATSVTMQKTYVVMKKSGKAIC
jgi:hypothetical protein